MEYGILRANSIEELAHQVNLHLNNGWILQGGVCVTADNFHYEFYQAMVFKG